MRLRVLCRIVCEIGERGREIQVELRLLEMSSSSRSFLVNIDISILVIPLRVVCIWRSLFGEKGWSKAKNFPLRNRKFRKFLFPSSKNSVYVLWCATVQLGAVFGETNQSRNYRKKEVETFEVDDDAVREEFFFIPSSSLSFDPSRREHDN